jgi:hypothetical protein
MTDIDVGRMVSNLTPFVFTSDNRLSGGVPERAAATIRSKIEFARQIRSGLREISPLKCGAERGT